jgi:hypothetical protein
MLAPKGDGEEWRDFSYGGILVYRMRCSSGEMGRVANVKSEW